MPDPSRSTLRTGYTAAARSTFAQGAQRKLTAPPARLKQALVFRNVAIAGLKGREDLYEVAGELYVKEKNGQRTTWFGAGQAPALPGRLFP
jgi:hypothetical protein